MLRRSPPPASRLVAAALVVLGGGAAIAVARARRLGRQAARPSRSRRPSTTRSPRRAVAGRHGADHVHEPPRRHARASRSGATPAAVRRDGPPVGGGRRPHPARAAVRPRRRADHERRQDASRSTTRPRTRPTGSRCRSDDDAPPSPTRTRPPTRRRHPGSARPGSPASADVGGAAPSNVAGRPAYTVRISPKHDGGLHRRRRARLGRRQRHAAARRGLRLGRRRSRSSSSRRPTSASARSPASDARRAAARPARRSSTSTSAATARQAHVRRQDVTGAEAVAGEAAVPLSRARTRSSACRATTCALVDIGRQQGRAASPTARGWAASRSSQQPADPRGRPAKGDDRAASRCPQVSIDGADGPGARDRARHGRPLRARRRAATRSSAPCRPPRPRRRHVAL